MKDEKYLYISDVKEKNSVARSAKNRRAHTGKRGGVKLPSDYLTKKELQNMSGECKSYRLNEPMKWAEFKEMPDDLKESYLKAIIKTYSPPTVAIAKMFGIDRSGLQREMTRLQVSSGSRGKRTWDEAKFNEWAYGVENKEEENAEEPVEEIPVEEPVITPAMVASIALEAYERNKQAVPDTGNMVFEGNIKSILNTLDLLLGDSKVHISITWDVVE